MRKVSLCLMSGILLSGAAFLVIRNLHISKTKAVSPVIAAENKNYYSVEEEWIKKCERKKQQAGKVDMEAKIKGFQDYIDGITIPFGADESPAPAGYIATELQKVRRASSGNRMAKVDVQWVERGPGNVGGRTRGLIVDPDDPSHLTWYAGSASRRLWKTTDGGESWTCLSDDLPYQTTTTLAMAKSNHNVIYMGTGESFPGSIQSTGGGILRSTDRGETWEHLDTTMNNEDFRYVNRIVVDPLNDSIVLAATSEGIFKSVDAGMTWYQTYAKRWAVEDLVADTSDFNYIFAGVNTVGVLRSPDAGETWENVSDGIGIRQRIELAISPTNSQKIYASVETPDGIGALYSSWDRGDSWEKVVNFEEDDYSLHGGQGMYDNTIAVDPYNSDIVFFGGVDLWKAQVSATTAEGDGSVTRYDTVNTASFLGFIDFTDQVFSGMSTGDLEDAYDLEESDWVSIEIRFGPGLSQKAHRFYVPLQATSGVPYTSYSYQDYVDVPFEVWDVTNNRQLMCSFRDQERDGEFNLYERFGENYGELGREYLFINAVEYDPNNPDPDIAQQGGRSYKLLYFFWPTLAPGASWDPDNLPDSRIEIDYGTIMERTATISSLVDVYGRYGGPNNYIVTPSLTMGSHADHHEIITIPVNEVTGNYWVLNANDGGLGISENKGQTFIQIDRNYPTTQFYGVSKKPYRNEYIGGMQDNGTWQSPINQEATASSQYTERIGGDGMETVWNYQDSSRLMGTLYYAIYRSLDHGLHWGRCDNGIVGLPFIVKLSPLPSNNNTVFTVAVAGVYKTTNFANSRWIEMPISEYWTNSTVEVTSSHQVKISPANENVIWAGGGMYESEGYKMHVSTDGGVSFNPVNQPDNPVPALISGLALHPTDENTAYVLYSLYGDPKIYRTTDLGDTWEDITQVNEDGESENGFPNVGVHSLIVFPDTTSMIWAGTEIGIMESLDNGETWHYLESNLPTVPVYHMFVQDNQVVASTYGRGIWTFQYGPELEPDALRQNTANIETSLAVYPNPSQGIINIGLENTLSGEARIEVFNMDGKMVYQEQLRPSSSRYALQVDLSHLKKGMYILRLGNREEHYTKRFVLE